MRFPPRLLAVVPALLASLPLASCGGEGLSGQDRPEIESVFPAPDQVLLEAIAYVRVTYQEPVEVLNDTAARLWADVPDEDDQRIGCRIFPDPHDPRSILVVPLGGDTFVPGVLHKAEIQEGAVVNRDEHYRLHAFDWYFVPGAYPNVFVTGADGNVYEVAIGTATTVGVTAPPAGYRAREPVGTSNRIWVWLDPVGPGPSQLGTLQAGDATVTVVPLAGEVGDRRGVGIAVSVDGRTVYPTTEDPGIGRALVHRVNVATQAEVGAPLVLSTPLQAAPATFRPAVDPTRNRLYVPFLVPGDAGLLAYVDLATLTEVDANPDPAEMARALPYGAGSAYVEPERDVVFLNLENYPYAAFLRVDLENAEEEGTRKEELPGRPHVGYPTTDTAWFFQGLDGYAGLEGIARFDADDVGEGEVIDVTDDVGGVLQGSTRIAALLRYGGTDLLYAFADDGVATTIVGYDVDDDGDDGDGDPVDLDPVTPGLNGLSLAPGVPTVVTGAAMPMGAVPP